MHFVAIHSSAAKNRKNTKIPIFGVHSHSRSSMLIRLKSMSSALVMISNMSVHICNRFYN